MRLKFVSDTPRSSAFKTHITLPLLVLGSLFAVSCGGGGGGSTPQGNNPPSPPPPGLVSSSDVTASLSKNYFAISSQNKKSFALNLQNNDSSKPFPETLTVSDSNVTVDPSSTCSSVLAPSASCLFALNFQAPQTAGYTPFSLSFKAGNSVFSIPDQQVTADVFPKFFSLPQNEARLSKIMPSNFVSGIYASGNTLYLATPAGLAKSTDGGQSWTATTTANASALGKGISSNAVVDIFVDKSSSTNRMYLNYYSTPFAIMNGHQSLSAGLSYSDDGGQTWTTRTTKDGLSSNAVSNVLAFTNPKTGIATVYVATSEGVCISTDGGVTFKPTTAIPVPAPASAEPSFVVADPTGAVLLAGTGSHGLWLSKDKGQTWNLVPITGSQADITNAISSMLVYTDPINHTSTLYTAFYDTNKDAKDKWAKIYSSPFDANGNLAFTKIYSGSQNDPSASVQALARNGNTLYAGAGYSGVQVANLLTSADNGENWSYQNSINNLPILNIFSLAVDNGKVYIGSGGSGYSVTADQGKTFTTNNKAEIHNTYATSGKDVAVKNGTIYLSSYQSLEKSTNNFDFTDLAANIGLNGKESITTIAVDNSNNNIIFVGTNQKSDGKNGGSIFRSTDGGKSFSRVSGQFTSYVASIVSNGQTVYCKTSYFSGKNGFFVSTDGGATFAQPGWWSQIDPSANPFNVIKMQGNMVYIGAQEGEDTKNGGLFVYNITDPNNVTLVHSFTQEAKELSYNNVTDVALFNNKIYIGTNYEYNDKDQGGLTIATPSADGKTFSTIIVDKTNGLPSSHVRSVAVNGSLAIILGTDDAGIARVSDDGKVLDVFSEQQGGLADNEIKKVTFDNGNLYSLGYNTAGVSVWGAP